MSKDSAVAAMPDTDAANRLRRLVMRYVSSHLVRAAATLGIADRLADGPRTNDQLATAIGADKDALLRFLRAVEVLGLVKEIDTETFVLASLGEALHADNGRLSSWAIAMAGPSVARPCEYFADVVISGKPATKQATGYEFWEYYDHHPEEAEHYAVSMSHISAHSARGLAACYDLTRYRRIVDIGGGHGQLISGILEASQASRGVLYDRAEVIERARGLVAQRGVADRLELVEGNFLEGVPEGGDLYTIKSVLCDWDEEHVKQILGSIYRAATPGTSLLVIDWMIADETPETTQASERAARLPIMNLVLLATTGGKVRSQSEYRKLVLDIGFEVERISQFDDGLMHWSLLEARR
jgi:predicted O-methyltransferase YrrM